MMGAATQVWTRLPAAIARHGQVFWSLSDQVVVSGSSFVTSVLVARNLGIEQFGIFALAWMAVLFAQSLQLASIAQPMLSIGPKLGRQEQPNYYATMLAQQLVFGLIAAAIAALIAIGAALFFGADSWSLALALPVVVFATQFQDFARRYNFSLRRSDIVFRSDVVRHGLQLGLLAGLFWAGVALTLDQVLYVIALAAAVGSLVTWRALPRLTLPLRDFAVILTRQVAFAKWLVGSALLQWTTGNFFVLVAGAMLGPVAVGALKAGQDLIGTTHLFFQAADNFVTPRAARAYETGGSPEMWTFLRKVGLVGFGVTLVIGAILSAAPDFWLTLVYGETYAGYGYVIWGFTLAYLVMSLSYPLRYAAVATEKTRAVFLGFVGATVFSLALSYPLVAILDIYGALMGVVGVQAIFLVVLRYFSRKRVGEPPSHRGAE
jgi:O-antigen/teichoic acid export membrane protein